MPTATTIQRIVIEVKPRDCSLITLGSDAKNVVHHETRIGDGVRITVVPNGHAGVR